MTSPWKDGIASDLEDSPPALDRFATAALLWEIKKGSDALLEHMDRVIARFPQQNCDCTECRAIVALVEEETIDKP